ncbi:hypothetical protein EAO76_43935 [Streptomyces sp. sk2.1]|nr:hypothetical protein EAO76_43935 [Streptomyces sp. sk2.1]
MRCCPRPEPGRPKYVLFASVSGTSKTVPSTATSRHPRYQAPAVSWTATGRQTRANSAFSGSGPSRLRRSGSSVTSTAGRRRPRSSSRAGPCSFVAALKPGATSWTAILDAVRLGPADDATAVTAAQLRGVVERLIAAGQWQKGDPHIVIVSDAGYDVTRLARVLRDLPVELVGRVRSDRSCACPSRPADRGRTAGRPGTDRSSGSPGRRPGPNPRSPLSPTPPTTARPKHGHGTGSIPGSPTVPHGSTTTANCPWSKAR